MVSVQILQDLEKAAAALGLEGVRPQLERPADISHGDYSSNIALVAFGKNQESRIKKQEFESPGKLAEALKTELEKLNIDGIQKIEVAGVGFLNFWLKNSSLVSQVNLLLEKKEKVFPETQSAKKIMIEYAHPNTHKEMHIGHMRTLITGEAIARILEAVGAKVFRVNYQGDIGPHVAKAMYGVGVLIKERGLTLDDVDKWSHKDKAHFLGEGYVRGNKDYEEKKSEIDALNSDLYHFVENEKSREESDVSKDEWEAYQRTRQWSLDYYDEFYERFYTTFDQFFFESQMVADGKKIVRSHIGDVFTEDQGTIVFKGEQYGLHTRVFITSAGHPTYEGKEMANAFAEHKVFPFDLKMHVVANEQKGYFQVIFKALELIDPETFKGKQIHISMGMVQLSDPSAGSGQSRKMSSRTGDILTVDWLIDQVKERAEALMKEGKAEDIEKIIEEVTIGAIKHSVLRVHTAQDAAFDIEKSVSLDGNSGPYLQYAYARTKSLLRKSANYSLQPTANGYYPKDYALNPEELVVLRTLFWFSDTVVQAAETLSPNMICAYLFDLSQKYNNFYEKHKIVGSDKEELRIWLTKAVGETIKIGLGLLGIKAPEKM